MEERVKSSCPENCPGPYLSCSTDVPSQACGVNKVPPLNTPLASLHHTNPRPSEGAQLAAEPMAAQVLGTHSCPELGGWDLWELTGSLLRGSLRVPMSQPCPQVRGALHAQCSPRPLPHLQLRFLWATPVLHEPLALSVWWEARALLTGDFLVRNSIPGLHDPD